MITPQNTQKEIQAAIDAGGIVEFAPGIYEKAHYRITGPVHLIGNRATLVGGRRIEWQRVEDIFARACSDETGNPAEACSREQKSSYLLCCDAPTGQPLRSLVVNGELRNRCRFPAKGYLQHESVFNVKFRGVTGGGWERKPTKEEMTTMRVPEGALDGLTLHSAEVTVVHSWDDSMVSIAHVEDQVVTFDKETEYPVGGFGAKNFCLWNVPEALQEAGTFYHDTVAGKLYYRPLEGENEDIIAYLPEYNRILYAEEAVSDVEIEGFTLMCTEPDHILAGYGARRLSGAVSLTEGSNICIHDLNITAVGAHGIYTMGEIADMKVMRCHVFGVGAGGIRVSNSKSLTGMAEEYGDYAKSEIADCHVHHVGLYFPSAIAIATVNCDVRHNEVHHTSYSGIDSRGDNIIIEKNFVYDTMNVMNDGAAIYSYGSRGGGIMRNNLVYGVQPKDGHRLRIAYYLDEMSRGWQVEHNVALECYFTSHNHMCGKNTFFENIFVNSKDDMLFDMLNTRWKCSYIGNVFSAGGKITVRMAQDGLEVFEDNRYHSQDGTLIQKVMKDGQVTGDRIMEMSDSNKTIEAVQFDKDERVFTVGDLTIDLRDIGSCSKF